MTCEKAVACGMSEGRGKNSADDIGDVAAVVTAAAAAALTTLIGDD